MAERKDKRPLSPIAGDPAEGFIHFLLALGKALNLSGLGFLIFEVRELVQLLGGTPFASSVRKLRLQKTGSEDGSLGLAASAQVFLIRTFSIGAASSQA